MSSRHYIKRVWRVPKSGPAEYYGALVTKALVKHGWPAKFRPREPYSVQVYHFELGQDAPEDFWVAVQIAARIVARTHRILVDEQDVPGFRGMLMLRRHYRVTQGGFFKEV